MHATANDEHGTGYIEGVPSGGDDPQTGGPPAAPLDAERMHAGAKERAMPLDELAPFQPAALVLMIFTQGPGSFTP